MKLLSDGGERGVRVETLRLVWVSAFVSKFVVSIEFFFFQAEDGIRDLVRSRGLGDVYKRQAEPQAADDVAADEDEDPQADHQPGEELTEPRREAVSYTHLTLPTIYPV